MKNTLWDIFINLKNSQISQRNFIYQPNTKRMIAFLNILWDENLISGYKIDTFNPNLLKIFLKYKNGNAVMNSLKLIFKPSRHLYYPVSSLWKLNSKKNLIILSTSKGLMTINECKQTKTGGKLICIIK